MRNRSQPRARRDEMAPELSLAIGLVWGHLGAGQFESAHELACGCLRLWPDERRLVWMAAYAAAELLEPLDAATLAVLDALRAGGRGEWAALVLRRAAAVEGSRAC
ncbi:hypothetical protein ACFOLJ_03090 [Rugamonas sp. CCM 8940]|uniref:hypothetical protein n=1 Tax=Rugamonas sp. CCM 8940 TaxID=2765359 RepID=UPI0018F4FEDD|nr:hypothetical protein [Rugamonas sp. CCM 8940]MBJ7311925.1 hypothetical protein [Rugamonas sp. CCM 8940]